MRAEMCHIKIHNVTLHMGGGWVVFNVIQCLTGGGWVLKNAEVRVTYYVNSPLR